MGEIGDIGQRVIDNVERVIIGKHREVQLVLAAMLCRGHVLIEDVPGVGKTILAKSFARVDRGNVQSHPVHAGSPPQRRHGRLDL